MVVIFYSVQNTFTYPAHHQASRNWLKISRGGLSILHGECPRCLAVITDTGIKRGLTTATGQVTTEYCSIRPTCFATDRFVDRVLTAGHTSTG